MFYTSTYLYIREPMRMFGLLIREAATSRLRTERGSTYKNYYLTPQLTVNNTCVWFNGELLHTQDNYFDATVYIQQ